MNTFSFSFLFKILFNAVIFELLIVLINVSIFFYKKNQSFINRKLYFANLIEFIFSFSSLFQLICNYKNKYNNREMQKNCSSFMTNKLS